MTTQEAQQYEMAGIHSRAMLVSLRISTWRASRLDKNITREVAERHGVLGSAGRYNKDLLPGAEPYADLLKAVNLARADHYANTLAWSDEGWRMLPSANYMAYTEMMRKHASKFDTALAEFVREYPSLQYMAQKLLNGMYRQEDYPTAMELQRKFNFAIEYAPLPAKGDFRLDLPIDEIATIEARIEDRVSKATREAVEDSWKRLVECVDRVQERLADPKNIFRDSLVANTRELVDTLSRLNVTNDPNLEAMRKRVSETLAVHEPQTLREDLDVREKTAKEAQDILAAMSAFYGGK